MSSTGESLAGLEGGKRLRGGEVAEIEIGHGDDAPAY